MLFAGTSHPKLAGEVADYLGVSLGRACIESFPDGETFVQLLENVRGRDVFVLQSTVGNPNQALMELLILCDALKRASASSIVALIPYYGYARQDRKDKGRVPITAKLVADLLETAGATRVVTMDLHAAQIQGFFNVPVDNLYGRPALVEALKGETIDVVACPDIGSVKIAREFADALDVDLAVVDKQRLSAHQVAITTLIGSVAGRNVLLVDDMISTAGTLVAAAEALLDRGAERVIAAATHGLFVGEAISKINKSAIEQVYVTNTTPQVAAPNVSVVSVAPFFGEAMRRIVEAESVSSLFN